MSPDIHNSEDESPQKQGKPRLRAIGGKGESKAHRNRPYHRNRGDENMRKAAGAEEIPFDNDPRFNDN